jgi:hypothetical protein
MADSRRFSVAGAIPPLAPRSIAVALLLGATAAAAEAQTVGWWRFDEGVPGAIAIGPILDSALGNHGTPAGSPIYAPVADTCATDGLRFDGLDDRITVPDSSLYANLRSMTVEAVLSTNGYNPSPFGLNQIVFRGDDRGGLDPFFLAIQSNGRLGFYVNNVLIVETPTPLPTSSILHVAATLDDGTGTAGIYVDGQLVASATTFERPTVALTGPLPGVGIGNVQSPNSTQYFWGTIYEVRLSSIARAPLDQLRTSARISQQPEATRACAGSTVSLSITASGTAPITFQWRKDTIAIDTLGNPSAANATLTLTNVGPADVASYDCVVTNACGSVTSSPATLSICVGDFNCDSGVDGDDVIAFFGVWDAGELAADVTGDGGVDGDDVIAFFGAWDGGC